MRRSLKTVPRKLDLLQFYFLGLDDCFHCRLWPQFIAKIFFIKIFHHLCPQVIGEFFYKIFFIKISHHLTSIHSRRYFLMKQLLLWGPGVRYHVKFIKILTIEFQYREYWHFKLFIFMEFSGVPTCTWQNTFKAFFCIFSHIRWTIIWTFPW